jgi:hypothetical protein
MSFIKKEDENEKFKISKTPVIWVFISQFFVFNCVQNERIGKNRPSGQGCKHLFSGE